jgi:hypothetical protein
VRDLGANEDAIDKVRLTFPQRDVLHVQVVFATLLEGTDYLGADRQQLKPLIGAPLQAGELLHTGAVENLQDRIEFRPRGARGFHFERQFLAAGNLELEHVHIARLLDDPLRNARDLHGRSLRGFAVGLLLRGDRDLRIRRNNGGLHRRRLRTVGRNDLMLTIGRRVRLPQASRPDFPQTVSSQLAGKKSFPPGRARLLDGQLVGCRPDAQLVDVLRRAPPVQA